MLDVDTQPTCDDMAEVVPFIIVGHQTINSICSVDYHVGFNMIPPYCAVYMHVRNDKESSVYPPGND